MSQAMNIMENKDEPYLDGKLKTNGTQPANNGIKQGSITQQGDYLKPAPPTKPRPQSAKVNSGTARSVTNHTRIRPKSARVNKG